MNSALIVVFSLILLIQRIQSVTHHQYDDSLMHPKDFKPHPDLKIINGNNAKAHDYPYQVGLFVSELFSSAFCGGSLIKPNVVLTAAHCVDGAANIRVVLGAQKINDNEEDTQVRLDSTNFVIHEDWDPSLLQNDIALIILDKKVTLNENIQTIPLPQTDGSTYADLTGTLTGWGITSDSSSRISNVLQVLQDTILSNDACKQYPKFEKIIQDTHLCISGVKSSSDGNKDVGSCSGDSGGPLVVNGVQVGVVSFGYKVCEAGLPSVFTRVSKYLSWISKNTAGL